MIKFVAMWNIKPGVTVADFEHWYTEKHIHDARRIPGLIRYTVSRALDSVAGAAPYYRMAELCFPSREAFEEAFGSAEWRSAFVDAQGFIADHVRITFESTDVTLE